MLKALENQKRPRRQGVHLKNKVASIHNKIMERSRLLAGVTVLEYSGRQKSKYGYYIEGVKKQNYAFGCHSANFYWRKNTIYISEMKILSPFQRYA